MAASDLSHADLMKRIQQLMAERIDDSYYSLGAGVQLLDRIIPPKGGMRPQNRNINRKGIASGGAGNGHSGGAKRCPKGCRKKRSDGRLKWIDHVKRYQKAHGISYKQALKQASASYRK